MNSKPFYQSWTLWLNALAAAGVMFQYHTGHVVFDVDLQAFGIAVLNFFLRFKTKQPVSMTTNG